MNMFKSALTRKDTTTANGAVSNSSSGSLILDYFAKCGSYRNRPQHEVNADMSLIFNEDEELALRCVLYNRLVTRKPNDMDSVQKGQGNKDEYIKSLKWIEENRPELLYKNLHLLPIVGCWKDLWYDSPVTEVYHYLSKAQVYPFVLGALNDDTQRPLIAKFLPKIRSRSNSTNDRHARLNDWARGFCLYAGISEKEYRKIKSDPNNKAHNFQRLMCDNKWNDIKFNEIPGKALFNLVKGDALEKHGVDQKYLQWIKSQPVAKFTGYPYELYKSAITRKNVAQTYTINKQFDGLVQLAQKSVPEEILNGGVMCALDTSGSMSIEISDNLAAIDVCIGLGVYFSSLLKGEFADTAIMFDSKSRIIKLKGEFCDKVDQIRRHPTAWGSTNFQSVIDEIVRVRKQNPDIPVEDYPKYLLIVSDMQFNPAGTSIWDRKPYDASQERTNYEEAKNKLQSVGLPEMSIIWWNVNGGYGKDVPSTINDKGTTLISGFDGSVLTNLLGGEQVNEKGEVVKEDPYTQMLKVLSQDILTRTTV